MPTTKRKPTKKHHRKKIASRKTIESDGDERFKDLVREAMKVQDLSTEALAKVSGVRRPSISRWLNNSRRLFSADIARLFEALGIKVKGYATK